MDSNERDKSDLPPGRGFAKDSLTVSHIELEMRKDFTVSHLAQALGSNTEAQTNNTQQTQNQAANTQTQQSEAEATGQKKG